MVGEPVVGVNIFFFKSFSQFLSIISYIALSGCLDTKQQTVIKTDIYFEL